MKNCKICGKELSLFEEYNDNGICDDCKASMIQKDGINLGLGEEFD